MMAYMASQDNNVSMDIVSLNLTKLGNRAIQPLKRISRRQVKLSGE